MEKEQSRGGRTFVAFVLMALGVAATPFFVDAFTSEAGQVAALCVAVFPLGFWAAAALSWRGPFFFIVLGVVLGFCAWVALLAYLQLRYPEVTNPPTTTWLVRFGGGVALSFAAGAIVVTATRGKRPDAFGVAATILGLVGTVMGFLGD
ncbi:hypothetical protein AB0J83_18325 [Actinoplanes sp. NPDC049596]|uniref:hypothetical protein n=1 Tax=unclassified Actinoplanes TaxID=2626549 RepID=UPI00341EEA7B